MSSAFVPGRIRREAPVSVPLPGSLPWSSNRETPGDAGPSWSSAMGGGEGRRGEEDGECAAIVRFSHSLIESGQCKIAHDSSNLSAKDVPMLYSTIIIV